MTSPPKARALYLPPGGPARPRPRSITLSTYRLSLTRENTGEVLHEWGGIPHDKVAPLLHAMQQYLPILAKAAAVKLAWSKVLALFQ